MPAPTPVAVSDPLAAPTPQAIEEALAVWGLAGDRVLPVSIGHINWTAFVETPGGRRVLQRVNPIFSPQIHHNIEAVTAHLAARGMPTPRLVPGRDGALYAALPAAGVWRLLTYVEGIVHVRAPGPPACAAAGALLGRFHRALADLAAPLVATRMGAHDTAGHLALLVAARARLTGHPAAAAVAPLAAEVEAKLGALPPLVAPRMWTAHGDAKISNIVFAADGEARALIDLDTLGPMAIAHELGDAWRSWCASGEESQAGLVFSPALLEAAWSGWRSASPPPLMPQERDALVDALPTIALELAARFARDALEERYFAWDRSRFAAAWQHNLLRARGQLALADSYLAQRQEAAAILAT